MVGRAFSCPPPTCAPRVPRARGADVWRCSRCTAKYHKRLLGTKCSEEMTSQSSRLVSDYSKIILVVNPLSSCKWTSVDTRNHRPTSKLEKKKTVQPGRGDSLCHSMKKKKKTVQPGRGDSLCHRSFRTKCAL